MLRVIAVLVAMLFLAGGSDWAAAEQLPRFQPGAAPKLKVQNNQMYGKVKFALESRIEDQKSGDPFLTFITALGALLSETLKNDGEYILTLEILPKDSGEPIARRAILQSKRESSGFLIFNRVRKETETAEWYGDILDSLLIHSDSNNVRIAVRAYYTTQTKFDLSTFNLILDFVTATKLLGAAPELQSAWKPIAEQMQKLLSNYEEKKITDIVSMSFAELQSGAAPHPQSGTFVSRYSYKGVKHESRLTVFLEPVKARVVTLSTDGKVEDPFSLRILSAARVGTTLVETVLANSKEAEVKKLLTGLQSDKGYEGTDVSDKCKALYKELALYFNTVDSLATYWALMRNYDRKLSLNKASPGCVDSELQGQLKKYGLPVDQIAFLKSVPSGTAPIAGPPQTLTPKDLAKLKDLVGERGKTFTYQNAPLTAVVPIQ